MNLSPGAAVVVTGAASGIGEAIARECVERGFRLALADIEKARLEDLVNELNELSETDVIGKFVDVADSLSVLEFAENVQSEFGRVDLVVANAGVIATNKPLWEQKVEDLHWILGVNLVGVFNTWSSFLPHMIETGSGHLAATSSVAGLMPMIWGGNSPYAASKYGVVGLAEAVDQDLRNISSDIGITVLFPGPVRTRIREALRNRPEAYGGPMKETSYVPPIAAPDSWVTLEPTGVAKHFLQAIEAGERYVISNPEFLEPIVGHLSNVSKELQSSIIQEDS
tara:strand:- start:303 stop:1148 length:846 start_codon:yes stop_codon:yes gene_type:complete